MEIATGQRDEGYSLGPIGIMIAPKRLAGDLPGPLRELALDLAKVTAAL